MEAESFEIAASGDFLKLQEAVRSARPGRASARNLENGRFVKMVIVGSYKVKRIFPGSSAGLTFVATKTSLSLQLLF